MEIPQTRSLTLANYVEASEARNWAGEVAATWGFTGRAVRRVRQVVSELAANAVVHGPHGLLELAVWGEAPTRLLTVIVSNPFEDEAGGRRARIALAWWCEDGSAGALSPASAAARAAARRLRAAVDWLLEIEGVAAAGQRPVRRAAGSDTREGREVILVDHGGSGESQPSVVRLDAQRETPPADEPYIDEPELEVNGRGLDLVAAFADGLVTVIVEWQRLPSEGEIDLDSDQRHRAADNDPLAAALARLMSRPL